MILVCFISSFWERNDEGKANARILDQIVSTGYIAFTFSFIGFAVNWHFYTDD